MFSDIRSSDRSHIVEVDEMCLGNQESSCETAKDGRLLKNPMHFPLLHLIYLCTFTHCFERICELDQDLSGD